MKIPKISKELYEQLEAPFTLDEISIAMKQLNNDRAPGTDGLTANFYKVFWGKLKNFILGLFNEIVNDESFYLTARRGILSLLEKSSQDMMKLTSWRPLTLLNLDNKLFTKVLAIRLEKCTDSIIHPSQTGFCKNRHMAENILKILEIMVTAKQQKKNVKLISFDFYKVFDSIEWEAIYVALREFGFEPVYTKMVKIIYTDLLVCAYNNGF